MSLYQARPDISSFLFDASPSKIISIGAISSAKSGNIPMKEKINVKTWVKVKISSSGSQIIFAE